MVSRRLYAHRRTSVQPTKQFLSREEYRRILGRIDVMSLIKMINQDFNFAARSSCIRVVQFV